ncbi:MAG: hypothetical protein L6R38_009238 [Xanthoria sp. 2 TBL-2021]|nr:MAG: hypothetical protein L6R38_009238 [Xanthoria sp. 2 TBL-2021]
MSFQRFDISPNPAGESKRPHLSVFRFASFQSSRRPSQAPPAYSPDDVLATQKQLHVKVLHWLRIAIASITFLVSIVIIACSATALRTYTNTRYNVEWILPLWPSTVDLRPTHALLACGVIVAVASIFYIVVAVAPTPLRSNRPLNLTFTILAFLSLFMTIFTTVFVNTIDSHLSDSTQAGSLASWTCKWQGFGPVAPGRFTEICTTSTAALDLVILMIVIESLSVLLAGWGWWVGAKIKREAKEGKGEVMHV